MTYNFTVGDLGFHKYISDEHPYERATAPFRKEQFDAAATVGDQSLTGWWTRGQLSFHKGAGVRYYEVLDGEEILNRYQDSEGVNPWTPGEVELADSITRVPTSTYVTSAAAHTSGGSKVAASLSDGTVVLVDDVVSAAQTVSPSATINNLTEGDSVLWGTALSAIYKSGGANFLDSHWTPPSGKEFWRSWWAKDRLWVVDYTNGDWYTLTDAGGAAADTDIFWAAGKGYEGWSLAETPSVVYLSREDYIYSVALDTAGAVPTVTAPTVAAALPGGETIACIFFYLGKLVIATNRGVRVAVMGQDGALTYGPLVIEGNFAEMTTMDARGDLVYVTGQVEGQSGSTLFALNLAIDVDDLIPAYAPVNKGGATGYYAGSVVDADGIVMPFDADGFLRFGTTPGTTGSITTGFHRLGTLDPKSFQYLRVKTEGTVGSVAVEALLPDGSSASVGTVTAGTSKDLPLGPHVPGGQEYIGLRFTFSGDGTSGPTLLGYQLKALPIPKRQRLIRVSLELYDTERGPEGRSTGAEGSAWTRLEMLEELEESNSVVVFTDGDTGETGTAYIESVELTQRNGSKGNSRANGFGGVLTITLRKVA